MNKSTQSKPTKENAIENSFNENIGDIITHFGEGGTVKTLEKINQKSLDATYIAAISCYNNNDYESSRKFFEFLCLIDHLNSKYFMGLGACKQMMGEYADALDNYNYIAYIDKNNPKNYLHSGECFLYLEDSENALECFDKAIKLSGNAKANKSTKVKAKSLFQVTKKVLKTAPKKK